MAKLKQADQQLDASLDDLGYTNSKNLNNGYTQ